MPQLCRMKRTRRKPAKHERGTKRESRRQELSSLTIEGDINSDNGGGCVDISEQQSLQYVCMNLVIAMRDAVLREAAVYHQSMAI
mmetsp:Transcript_10021/g.16124  ORF Transcript_10021/g.16124 Transcript_10021/m.16124 type:complete len:85 (-) Transcript_10021:93-347(-)